MNLYIWKNENSESDFLNTENCVMPNSSNAHSGGVVVLAETEEEAIELIKKHSDNIDIRNKDSCDYDKQIDTNPIVIPLNDILKKGIVLYCDGDC